MSAPAAATVPDKFNNPATAYVEARAASISGNHAEAAQIYAALSARSNDRDLGQRAIAEAISAGDMTLALRLIGRSGQVTSVDSKLLVVADALRRGRNSDALRFLPKTDGGGADLSFWNPLVRAWDAVDRRDPAGALAILSQVSRSSAFSPFVDEESAYILLKVGNSAQADPYARRAIASAGAREYRVRLAMAAGFANAGDRDRALSIIDGISGDTTALRSALDSGGLKGLAIDNAARAFSDQLLALALQMRNDDRDPDSALNVIQIAHFAAPANSAGTILLGKALAEQGKADAALNILATIDDHDPLQPEAMDSRVRALLDSKRVDEALSLATAAAGRSAATSDDFARLGDVYAQMDRDSEAAEAYRQAVARLGQVENARVWPLLLLEASSLEFAGRWPEAKAALASAIAMAPDQPLILNFLGYAKLEHGEDLDAAEALIRKASELAPDDASITDSLGWALYKRGRIDEAIDILQKAAAGDPAQADIQEHLGDALYSAGRRFEARFAWRAALATADDKDTARLKKKIDSGLTKATAAP